jgi:hypothetical protein
MPMNDEELATFCGFKPTNNQAAVARYIAGLSPAKRAMMETMRQIEMSDASDGLIPMPPGVILCGPKQCREGKRK